MQIAFLVVSRIYVINSFSHPHTRNITMKTKVLFINRNIYIESILWNSAEIFGIHPLLFLFAIITFNASPFIWVHCMKYSQIIFECSDTGGMIKTSQNSSSSNTVLDCETAPTESVLYCDMYPFISKGYIHSDNLWHN